MMEASHQGMSGSCPDDCREEKQVPEKLLVHVSYSGVLSSVEIAHAEKDWYATSFIPDRLAVFMACYSRCGDDLVPGFA